jgi:predicted acylesterase/phospholipase RssA
MGVRAKHTPRIGLALAAGGPMGGVYEIGALRALEEAIEGLDFTDLHVYVGVSAGAFITAKLANGRTTCDLVRGLIEDNEGEPVFDPSSIFVPAYREWAKRGAQLPSLFAETLQYATNPTEDQSFFQALTRLTRALPLGLFNNEAIQKYLHRAFSRKGRTDDFRKLKRKLYVVATDLEAGKAVVFGSDGLDHVPISKAVQASTAVPGLYPPVKVEGRLCVDGVLLRTAHASIALEEGAELLFCINPLVPIDLSSQGAREAMGPDALQRGGLPSFLAQTIRTLIHSRMRVGMDRYAKSFPQADIALFEPDSSEYPLFFSNIFSFRSRRQVCEIAYRATRTDLWRRREELAPMLKRQGLKLRLDVLQETRSVWERVGLPERRSHTLSGKLSNTLRQLEAVLQRERSA